MSVKTAIKDHLATNSWREHFKNSSFTEHLENTSLKNHCSNHWDYFFQNNLENRSLEVCSTDNQMNFRRFSCKDLDECAELFIKVFSADPWYDNWISLLQAINYLGELIENPVFEGFVACEGSNIVAVCLGHRRSWWLGNEFFVDEFFVENKKQGNGIGTKMMDYVTSNLASNGYVRVILLTNKDIPAESFYLKNGFKNNPRRTVLVKTLP